MSEHGKFAGWAARLPFLRPAGSRETAEPGIPPGTLRRLAREERKALLDAIVSFHIDHDLPVTPETLTAAYDAESGASPSLARRIENRKRSGEAVTLTWLMEIVGDSSPDDDHLTPRRLMGEFDTTLEQFTQNTRAVRSMTHEYGSEIGRHLDDLDRVGNGADAVARLTQVAQAMADRTRKAENELRDREQETRRLRKRLNKLQHDADHDHLTGLPNRRAFEAEFERAVQEAKDSGEALSLAFCDLDHFKQVNDVHGHDTGDRVLKLVAQELLNASGGSCHVSRHGGEEFVMLFRGATTAEAKARLDRTREALSKRRLVNRDSGDPIGGVTFSAGVADVRAFDNPRYALIVADEALLLAKETGRNRVIEASPDSYDGARQAA
ncbi:MAG TPA: GGDEF domain-containing protein [Croceibacterium sp.]|nr:GGDEF domain-containing protein [Croceibacterium sp.]